MEKKLASLYGQIQPWVRTTLDTAETRIRDILQDEMLDFVTELHAYINVVDSWVLA